MLLHIHNKWVSFLQTSLIIFSQHAILSLSLFQCNLFLSKKSWYFYYPPLALKINDISWMYKLLCFDNHCVSGFFLNIFKGTWDFFPHQTFQRRTNLVQSIMSISMKLHFCCLAKSPEQKIYRYLFRLLKYIYFGKKAWIILFLWLSWTNFLFANLVSIVVIKT